MLAIQGDPHPSDPGFHPPNGRPGTGLRTPASATARLAGWLSVRIVPLALTAAIVLQAIALQACHPGAETRYLGSQDVRFQRGEIAFVLPDGHPWDEVSLLDASSTLLIRELVPTGRPLRIRFTYSWTPRERMFLSLADRSHRERVTRTLPLQAPAQLPSPVEVRLHFPSGVPLEPAGAPILLPAGARGVMGLSLRSRVDEPLHLTLRVEMGAGIVLSGTPRSAPDEFSRSVLLEHRDQAVYVELPFRVREAYTGGAAALRWSVEGAALPAPMMATRAYRVLSRADLRSGLQPGEMYLPADVLGTPLGHLPRDTITIEPAWLRSLQSRLGWGAGGDRFAPATHVRVEMANGHPGGLIVTARSYVLAAHDEKPLPAFGDPWLEGASTGVSLVSIPAGEKGSVVHPVYLDLTAIAPGDYRFCTGWQPWGLIGDPIQMCRTFQVVEAPLAGWLAIWLATGLSLLILAWTVARMGRWTARFALRDLVLIALFAGLAFVVVSIPYALVQAVGVFLLGPFLFLADGLLFKLLLFLLLGTVFVLVPRPGIYTLFYLIWMVFQAVLNGHYTPAVVLFAGVAVVTIESGLWLSGITRLDRTGAGQPGHFRLSWRQWLAGAVLIGICEAVVIFWHLQLIKVLYRQYLADWYVLLPAFTGGVYAALGTAMGMRLGAALRRIRRPPLAHPVLGDQDAEVPASTDRSATAPLLHIDDLHYTYPGAEHPALAGIGLTLEPGEIVLLAGASGAGKTSLLRAIQGILPVPPEAVRYRGVAARAYSSKAWARRSALLFQEPNLQVIRRTVKSEVAFGSQTGDGLGSGTPISRIEGAAQTQAARTRTTLRTFALENLADRSVTSISGGELQRTALASLMAGSPQLLMLDEPLASLDDGSRQVLLKHLALLARKGVAILAVEHRVEPILRIAHRVGYLERGRLVWMGSAEAFRRTGYYRASHPIPPVRRVPQPVPAQGGESVHGRASHAPPLLRLDGVTVGPTGSREALFPPVAATIEPGRAVALTGVNGAGKSTLLECIVGLRRPLQGTVALGGSPLAHMSWHRRASRVGYLPQQSDFILQAATAYEELAFGLNHTPQGEPVTRRVERWLERLGMRESAARFPHLFSKGERQRLALAAVMINGPQLLVLDEPFAGQDARHVRQILELCREYLLGDAARGLIMATHDLAPIRSFFDEVWHLGPQGMHTEIAGEGQSAAALGGGS